MKVTLANYIRFKLKRGGYVESANYQNFFVSESRPFNGQTYRFAPFRISGNISSKGGDGSQASLTSVPNAITVGLCTEAVSNKWIVEIATVVIIGTPKASVFGDQLLGPEPVDFSEGGVISTEIWMCGNLTQDYERITIGLMSPLDAARKQVPRRVLSESLCGSVPPTGSIRAS